MHSFTPGASIVDLLNNALAFEPRLSTYLLGAYAREFSKVAVFACLIDPGLGFARNPLVVSAGEHWYVGPNNRVLHVVTDRGLSDRFHGQDLITSVGPGGHAGRRRDQGRGHMCPLFMHRQLAGGPRQDRFHRSLQVDMTVPDGQVVFGS